MVSVLVLKRIQVTPSDLTQKGTRYKINNLRLKNQGI